MCVVSLFAHTDMHPEADALLIQAWVEDREGLDRCLAPTGASTHPMSVLGLYPVLRRSLANI